MEVRRRARDLQLNPGPGEYVVGEAVLYLLGLINYTDVSQVIICTCDKRISSNTIRGIIHEAETHLSLQQSIVYHDVVEKALPLVVYPSLDQILLEWDFAFDGTSIHIGKGGISFLEQLRARQCYESRHIHFQIQGTSRSISGVAFGDWPISYTNQPKVSTCIVVPDIQRLEQILSLLEVHMT